MKFLNRITYLELCNPKIGFCSWQHGFCSLELFQQRQRGCQVACDCQFFAANGTQFKERQMNQIGEVLRQYATTEVLTVLGTLVMAAVGWKVAKGTLGLMAGIAKKASFMGLASAALLTAGLSMTGFGIGELNSRPSIQEETTNVTGLSNNDLLKIVNNEKAHPELVKVILDYAQARDKSPANEKHGIERASSKKNQKVAFTIEGNKLIPVSLEEPVLSKPYDEITVDPVKEAAHKAEESVVSLPFAWSSIGLGLALAISGVAAFANRNNRRNPDDPHHPNFDSQYKRTA
jgi:hypothetical protein